MEKIVGTTLFLGKNIIEFEELPSTNSYLLNHLSDFKEGTIVICQNQVSGRGQVDAVWKSEKDKNLTFSLLLEPQFLKPMNQFILSKMICYSIYELLKSYKVKKIAIKWPNDIYCSEKKIAGILIENQINSKSVLSAVVGIGLNVNQIHFGELENVTSLISEIKEEVDLFNILSQLVTNIEKNYIRLKAGKDFSDEYMDLLYRKGVLSNFESSQLGKFKGIIKGVDTFGRLILAKDHQLHHFNNKEIRFLK